MAYCTEADLITAISTAEVAQLSDDTGAGSVNSANVTGAIEKADKYINLKCRGTHTVPWATTPEPIGWISIDLSVRNLYERRANLEANDAMKGRWKRAEALLTDIANGKVLIDDSTSFSNTAGIWATSKSSTDKVYTDTYLSGY